ncbi:MAG: RNA-directed DNA polymerase [Phycisphaerales bacterium]|jgi:RNA-directed DNA polymerase|nr:RNA-directed DNA polymerase [Phycisphaerales bacterium]
MGLFDWIKRLLGIAPKPKNMFVEVDFRGRPQRQSTPEKPLGDLMELSRRLAKPVTDMQLTPVRYDKFTIPKRSGGQRQIMAPCPKLKEMQSRILHRLLGGLRAHRSAMGFERDRSIVTNALPHVGAAVIVRMDIRDFFPSTDAARVHAYFRGIGWDTEVVDLLVKLTTLDGGLPQGAPTSPRLSNLLNYLMDARLDGLARSQGGVYTRYADDMTFSFPTDKGNHKTAIVSATKDIVGEYGYRLHLRRKLSIRRSHQQQLVTGLVVNEKPALPRKLRRKLRAIRHRLETQGQATLTEQQLAGWDALTQMIETQRTPKNKQ